MVTMKTIKDLRARYNKAVKNNEEQFTIEGYEFVTLYAKYLLEFLEMKKIPEDTALRTIIQKGVTNAECIAG